MKNTLFLRKDLQVDVNRLTRICINTGRAISQYNDNDWKVDIKEVMILNELYDLEDIFITEGMHFQWIEDNKTPIGIVAISIENFTPPFMTSYKEYTPDKIISNLKEVQKDFKEKMQE